MLKKICLLSITASHYRSRIYELIDNTFECRFIFGVEDTSVKRMDTSILHDVMNNKNIHILHSPFYYQHHLLSQTAGYQIIINDLGIFSLSSWILLFLSKIRRQHIFHWDHGWYGRESWIKRIIKRTYFCLADGAFIYGNYARNLMIQNGIPDEKLHVIHNSLDYDRQLKIRQSMVESDIFKRHFHNDRPVICFIGRLTRVKRLDLLLTALHIMKTRGHVYNLVIIGDGKERQSVEDIITSYNMESKVWLYGACYDEIKNATLIYNSDLCVSPGNVGLTAIHAMMFGCPVITHRDFEWQMPEFEAINEGITGDFFEHDDVSSLSQAIIRWMTFNKDRRNTIREACFKETDEQWNPHIQLQTIEKAIDLLDSKG